MDCQRCKQEPADYYREGLGVCEQCARILEARAAVNATWSAISRAAHLDQWEARARLVEDA